MMMNFFPIHRYAGLDLGQRADHSALALLELCVPPTGPRDPFTGQLVRPIRLHLRYLQRYALGQSYPKLAQRVREFLLQPELRNAPLTLTVDATGPGLPFLDFFTVQPIPARLIKLMITAGGAPHYTSGYYHVSRRHLVSNLGSLLQHGALRLSPKLAEIQTLRAELMSLQHNARSTGPHDDLALAVALAAWQAAHEHRHQLLVPSAAA